MYTAVPGRTGAVAVRNTASKKVEKKSVAKPAATITKPYTTGVVCSAKGGPVARKARCLDDGDFKSDYQIGKERRKCQRTHLRRRHADIYRSA